MKKFDLYGYSVPINTLGQEKYTTWFGFSLTIISIIIVLVCSFLFGQDLFFKTNPRIINSEEFPNISDPIFVNSANLSIAWRYEDFYGADLPDELRFVWPTVTYLSYKRDESGLPILQHEIYSEPKPCSQTRAVENLTLPQGFLYKFLCVDFEDIKRQGGFETDVPLYGDWDEDSIYYLLIQNNSCKFNYQTKSFYNCITYEEADRRNKLLPKQNIYVLLPRLNLRPSSFEEPINLYVEPSFTELNPIGSNHDDLKYSKVTIESDVGWIFTDLKNLFTIEKTQHKSLYTFLSADSFAAETGVSLFSQSFMFNRKQLLYKRSYMKVQELAANIGGIFKFVSQIFTVVAQFVGNWIINNELISIFFKSEEREEARIRENAHRSSSNIVKDNKIKIKVGFCKFLANRMCCKNDNLKKAREVINSALDIKEIYKNHLKIEFLCHHLLNEETLKNLDLSIRKDFIKNEKLEPRREEVQAVRIEIRPKH